MSDDYWKNRKKLDQIHGRGEYAPASQTKPTSHAPPSSTQPSTPSPDKKVFRVGRIVKDKRGRDDIEWLVSDTVLTGNAGKLVVTSLGGEGEREVYGFFDSVEEIQAMTGKK
jgi:hypothetical protein